MKLGLLVASFTATAMAVPVFNCVLPSLNTYRFVEYGSEASIPFICLAKDKDGKSIDVGAGVEATMACPGLPDVISTTLENYANNF